MGEKHLTVEKNIDTSVSNNIEMTESCSLPLFINFRAGEETKIALKPTPEKEDRETRHSLKEKWANFKKTTLSSFGDKDTLLLCFWIIVYVMLIVLIFFLHYPPKPSDAFVEKSDRTPSELCWDPAGEQ